MQDLAQLTLDELSKMISDAQKALDARKISERKAVIGQIHELAASIGVTVTIQGEKTREGYPVVKARRWPRNTRTQIIPLKLGPEEVSNPAGLRP